MNRKQSLLIFIVLLLIIPTCARAQQWSGIIDPSRAVDWSNAGIPLGIPNRTTICATLSPGVTPAQISSAIASCPSGQVVFLSAGTYNLPSAISFGRRSNVTLRGQGANSTFLVFSGAGGGYNSLISMEGSTSANGFEENVCDWTGGYSRGTTVITLANCGSTTPAAGSLGNLKVGSVLILDQVDEAADTGTIWNCATQNVCANTIQGGEARNNGPAVNGVSLRSHQQGVVVTAINGNQITISPGLYMPNWRSSQLPQAWFATTTITGDGLENLSFDNCAVGTSSSCTTAAGSLESVIIENCNQCWVKGVRGLWANRSHVRFLLTTHSVLRDSYFYQNISHATVSYGVEMMGAWDTLIENNIMQQDSDSVPSCSGACEGNVVAYNLNIDNTYGSSAGWMQAGFQQHSSGDGFNLWEGNTGPGYNADVVHGTHHFETLFRNYLSGFQSLCAGATCNAQTVPIQMYAGSRYFNIIGNVLGKAGYHNRYQCNASSGASCPSGNHPGGTGSDTSIYYTGYTGNGAQPLTSITGYCGDPTCATRGDFDPQVNTYLYRWGNYDVVNNAVQWNASEVPTGISSFSNAVPSSQVLPASFYLSAKPGWWGATAWPPIGPDVTGGNITGVGGLANKTPAQLCYTNVMGGPADGTGSVLTFNASTCYGSLSTPPASPTNLTVIVH